MLFLLFLFSINTDTFHPQTDLRNAGSFSTMEKCEAKGVKHDEIYDSIYNPNIRNHHVCIEIRLN